MRSQSRTALAAVALAALAALALLAAEPLLAHTDDGCAVEIHCLACRLAIATPSLPAAPAAAPAVQPLDATLARPSERLFSRGHAPAASPRGPPASSPVSA